MKEYPQRPQSLSTTTEGFRTGCGTCYITMSKRDEEYMEIFAMLGKSGGCSAAFVQSLTRCLTIALNYGADPEKLSRQLIGITCPQSGGLNLSCPEVIGLALKSRFMKPYDPDGEE